MLIFLKQNKLFSLGPVISVHYFFTSLEVILMVIQDTVKNCQTAFIHLQIMQAHCVQLPVSKLSEIRSACSDRLCAYIMDILKNNKLMSHHTIQQAYEWCM